MRKHLFMFECLTCVDGTVDLLEPSDSLKIGRKEEHMLRDDTVARCVARRAAAGQEAGTAAVRQAIAECHTGLLFSTTTTTTTSASCLGAEARRFVANGGGVGASVAALLLLLLLLLLMVRGR